MGQTLKLWFIVARGRSQFPSNWKKFIPWLGTVFSQQQRQKPQKGHGGFGVWVFWDSSFTTRVDGDSFVLTIPFPLEELLMQSEPVPESTAHERKYPLPGALLRMWIWLDCVIPLCLCVADASNLDYLPFRERAHSSCRIPLLWVRTDVIHFLPGCVRRSAWDKSVFWMR